MSGGHGGSTAAGASEESARSSASAALRQLINPVAEMWRTATEQKTGFRVSKQSRCISPGNEGGRPHSAHELQRAEQQHCGHEAVRPQAPGRSRLLQLLAVL